MRRVSLLVFALMLIAPVATADPRSNADGIDGVWEITALIDDGEVIPSAQIRQSLAVDAKLTINGQAVALVKPGSDKKKTILFSVDPNANPPTIDLAGADNSGGKGIYVVTGDTLMICLSGPDVNDRPTSFASKAGSRAMLMTLQRTAFVSDLDIPVKKPAPITRQLKDDDIRKILVGTWGHQDSDRIERGTFNSDGSFSMTLTWKKAIKRFFDDDGRFSGDWKLNDGVLIIRITGATDDKVRGQVYTYRINSISDSEMILVDDTGKVRREWKTR